MNIPSINILALLVELLADQEGVKIKYEIGGTNYETRG